MYTRCPSCRAEISFEPPANAANLPDGYKYRIKCPSCGVTIGVKLPSRDAIATVQPTFTPANSNAFPSEPIYNAAPYEPTKAETRAAKRASRAAAAPKKSGRSRNFFIFLFSALLLVCSLLGYFYLQGKLEVAQFEGLVGFDGITMLKKIAEAPEIYKAMFEADIALGLWTVMPVIFFLGSILTAALALMGFVFKKYPRLVNLVLALGTFALTLCMLFAPFVMPGTEMTAAQIADYFTDIIESGAYLIFVPVGISLLQALFSLVFLKSMKKKAA